MGASLAGWKSKGVTPEGNVVPTALPQQPLGTVLWADGASHQSPTKLSSHYLLYLLIIFCDLHL